MTMTLHDLRVQLCRVQYGKHVGQTDFEILGRLLQTLAEYDQRGWCHEMLTSVSCGKSLQERLLIMRQWAIVNQRNRLLGDVDAALNVLESYQLGR